MNQLQFKLKIFKNPIIRATMANEEKKMYGWRVPSGSTSFYLDVNGMEVEVSQVTSVSQSPYSDPGNYFYGQEEYVGELVRWLRTGKKDHDSCKKKERIEIDPLD